MAKKHFTIEEAEKIGKKLGCDWKMWSIEEMRHGMDVELEHEDVTGGDLEKTALLTLAHLREIPDYYDRLDKMEKEASKYWAEKDSQGEYNKTLY